MSTVLLVVMLILFVATMFFMLRKLEQIHVLVNSRLSTALREIRVLKEQLGIPHNADDEE